MDTGGLSGDGFCRAFAQASFKGSESYLCESNTATDKETEAAPLGETREPWCLSLEVGAASGADALGFAAGIEDNAESAVEGG